MFFVVLAVIAGASYLWLDAMTAPLPVGGSATTSAEHDGGLPFWLVLTVIPGIPVALFVSFLYALVVDVAFRSGNNPSGNNR